MNDNSNYWYSFINNVGVGEVIMGTTCFISFSHDIANREKVNKLNNLVNNSSQLINFSERKDKSMYSEETIWNYLHDRIAGSSCTILFLTRDLLTYNSHKINYVRGNFIKSGWIYNEISASLRDWKDNRINGVVCVVDDDIAYNVADFNGNIIKENLPAILSFNSEYIIWATYSYFMKNPYEAINKALINREKQIKTNNNAFNVVYDLHKW